MSAELFLKAMKGKYPMADKYPGISYDKSRNRYIGRFMLDGKTYSVHGKEQKEAFNRLVSLRYEVEHGLYCDPTKETIDSWFEFWMVSYKEPKLKFATIQTYRQTFKLHISPVIGRRKLDKVPGQAIQKLLNDLQKNELSSSRLHMAYVVLCGMFKRAMLNGVIAKNPMDCVECPKTERKRPEDIRVLTVEEQQLFLDMAEDSKYRDFFKIALSHAISYKKKTF